MRITAVSSIPSPTIYITRDFDWSETENNRLLFEMTSKYGTPYFSNYINSDMEPSDVRSMCCCLWLDLRELRKNPAGSSAAASPHGSMGVVTINMPRIAFLQREYGFHRCPDWMMDISAPTAATSSPTAPGGLYPQYPATSAMITTSPPSTWWA